MADDSFISNWNHSLNLQPGGGGTSDASNPDWSAQILRRQEAAIKAAEDGARPPRLPYIPETAEELRHFPGFPTRSSFNSDEDFFKEAERYHKRRRHSRQKKRKKMLSSSSNNTPLGAPPPKRPRNTPPGRSLPQILEAGKTCQLIVSRIGNDGKAVFLPKEQFMYLVKQVHQAWLKDYRAKDQVYKSLCEGIVNHYWRSGRGIFDCEVVNNISLTRDWLIKEIGKVKPIADLKFKGWLPEQLEPLIQATVFLDNRFGFEASDAKDTIFASLDQRQLDISGMAVYSTIKTFAKPDESNARRHTGWLVKLTMNQELAEQVKYRRFKAMTGSFVFEFADLKVAPTAASAASTAASAASTAAPA